MDNGTSDSSEHPKITLDELLKILAGMMSPDGPPGRQEQLVEKLNTHKIRVSTITNLYRMNQLLWLSNFFMTMVCG